MYNQSINQYTKACGTMLSLVPQTGTRRLKGGGGRKDVIDSCIPSTSELAVFTYITK